MKQNKNAFFLPYDMIIFNYKDREKGLFNLLCCCLNPFPIWEVCPPVRGLVKPRTFQRLEKNPDEFFPLYLVFGWQICKQVWLFRCSYPGLFRRRSYRKKKKKKKHCCFHSLLQLRYGATVLNLDSPCFLSIFESHLFILPPIYVQYLIFLIWGIQIMQSSFLSLVAKNSD